MASYLQRLMPGVYPILFVSFFLLVFAGPGGIPPLTAQNPVDPSIKTNGDVNADGKFDIFDLIRLERLVTLGISPTPKELMVADVDGNHKLTSFDLLVFNSALRKVNQGLDMFEAIKSSIEDDLGKAGDNVQIYLDLANYYRKEGLLARSKSVLESIVEAMDKRHPLYNEVNAKLAEIKAEEASELADQQDVLNQDIYLPSEDLTGKVGLRQKVVQLQSRLSNMLKDKGFAANYNSTKIQSRLGTVMGDMLRQIGKDRLVDPESFTDLGNQVKKVLEDPENLVKSLNTEQKEIIHNVLDTSTASLRDDAVKLKQDLDAQRERDSRRLAAEKSDNGLPQTTILDRRDLNRRDLKNEENLQIDRVIVANKPAIEPDTISLVAPLYTLKWDVSNVLGAKNAALEISKANLKFSNPRGNEIDKENTLYYTPSLGTVLGERKGSANELEGVGTYQYRVAALNAKGELISRFSESTELVVVTNNVDIIALKPQIEPTKLSLDNPNYTFRWDVSNVDGAKDAAVEISKPNTPFNNPNGRNRDRTGTFFYNPSLGRLAGTFSSSVEGLAGPGTYLFRVIAISTNGDFAGRWSDPETLSVSEKSSAPEPVKAKPAQPSPVMPGAPGLVPASKDLNFSWDVSKIAGARGVNLEVARFPANTLDAEKHPEAFDTLAVLTQQVDSLKGSLILDPAKLVAPGDYFLRMAAHDSTGAVIGDWSIPSRLIVNSTTDPGNTAPAQQKPAASLAALADSLPPSKPGEAVPPPPQGESLEATSNNTPLYVTNNPTSEASEYMKKGELMVRVRTDGLWHYVYCPTYKKYGWVLTYNVKNSGGK